MMGMCLISSGLRTSVGGAHLQRLTDSTPLALTMRAPARRQLGCEPEREALGRARPRPAAPTRPDTSGAVATRGSPA